MSCTTGVVYWYRVWTAECWAGQRNWFERRRESERERPGARPSLPPWRRAASAGTAARGKGRRHERRAFAVTAIRAGHALRLC